MDAFFFDSGADLRLFGVWRGPRNAPRAWAFCAPFAEEEKGARRVFTLIAQRLEARGEASLLFSWRGMGDSEGDFGQASLNHWRQDLGAACREVARRAPNAALALFGARLGASLAWQDAPAVGARKLVLIEPLLSGRAFLAQQNARKRLRAQLTGEPSDAASQQDEAPDDLDGWPLGAAMKSELGALDLRRETPAFRGPTRLLQVGPRAEVAPPLQALADATGALTGAVVMPPFWNLLDWSDPAPLLRALDEAWDD